MKKLIITEQERKKILKMYGLINESSGGGLYLAEVIDFTDNFEKFQPYLKSLSEIPLVFYDEITGNSDIKIIFNERYSNEEKSFLYTKEELIFQVNNFISQSNECDVPIRIPVYLITCDEAYKKVSMREGPGVIKYPENPIEIIQYMPNFSKGNLKAIKQLSETNFYDIKDLSRGFCLGNKIPNVSDYSCDLLTFICSISKANKFKTVSNNDTKKEKKIGFVNLGIKEYSDKKSFNELKNSVSERSRCEGTNIFTNYLMEIIIGYGGEMWETKSELETNYLEFINKANETCKLNFNVGVKLTTFDISQFGELPNVPSDGTAILYSKNFSEIKDKYSNLDIDYINKCSVWIDSTSSHDKDLFNTNKHYIDVFCSIGKN